MEIDSGARVVCIAANPSIDRFYAVDSLASGSINRPVHVVVRPGGKGLNAARAGHALGGNVTAVSIVAGRAGGWIADELAKIGLDARLVRTEGETRTCISILDRSAGTLTEVYERGASVDAPAWAALEAALVAELQVGDVAAVTISGSLPPSIPSDGYARLVRICKSAGVTALIDADGSALREAMPERPAVVKINAMEAADACGFPTRDHRTAVAAGRLLLNEGPAAVIITLGAAGAVVVGDQGAFLLSAPDVQGLYSVGSGDAFLIGLAIALVSGGTLEEAARSGMTAGIANALVPGAGDLDRTVAERMAGRIRRAGLD